MFFRKPSDHVPHVTIFHTILRSMLWILFIEIALLVGILYLCRINTNLEQNAVDILQIQTENRQNYLQGQMLDAQDLSSLAGKINAVTQAMLDDGEISLDTLDSGSDAASPLLLSIGDSLISSMRHRPVTGIFVVLNTHDLDTRKKGEPLPCLYLRDLDPNSSPSQRNSDLMLVRAPAQVVQSLYIATDTSWTPSINYGANGSSGFLYPVFQAAYHGNGELDAADYGHWTSSPYTLSGDDHSAIAYTIPLILDDGTVYGVLGVEILESYLQALLPGTELQNDSSGTYLLGVASNSAIGKDDLTVSVISASPAANAPQQSYDQTLLLKPSKRGGYQSDSPLGPCHAAVAPLTLYNRNAPFSNEQMLLIGSVPVSALYAFSGYVLRFLIIAVLVVLTAGLFSSLVLARKLSRERLRITEERFKIGSFSRLDLLQARVDFNADSSKYMSQHELVTASRIRINELLANDDLNGRLSICDSLIEVNSTLEWDRLEAETRAANASLLLAGHDNTLAELDLKSIRSRFYPYLNLTAGYGYTYNRFGNGATQSRGTLGLNAGVKLGFTIFDGNRRREQRNARITIENTELTRQQLEQSLMANLSNFWQAYRNNLEVIQLETENLIAARENYEIAMERYLLGDLPGIEMREAQKSLLDAEERILTAQYNTKLCEISLQQISGNIGVYLQ